ncbi:unnamed protein product, partial [Pylaiella littoralis]
MQGDARCLLRSVRRNSAHPTFEFLDTFFCDCLERVEAAYATLDKACKIRVECWVVKLNGPYPLPNVAWRKNRNAFAALLARAVEEVDFREPFDRRPPEGSLPTLAPHLRARIPDRNPFRRIGREFWEQQRAWLDTNRGCSGRKLVEESRTFRPTSSGGTTYFSPSSSPAPRQQGGNTNTTIIGGFGGGGGGGGRRGCCGVCGAAVTTLNRSGMTAPPSPSEINATFSPRTAINSYSNNGNNNGNSCSSSPSPPCAAAAAAARAAYSAWTNNNRSSCHVPLRKARFGGGGAGGPPSSRSGGGGGAGKGVSAEGCGRCGCDAGGRMRTLQTMVREQALQIGALRIQQAFRGRVQAAELQRIRHEHIRETEGIQRLRQDEARSRLTSVRLEELLATRGGGRGGGEGGGGAEGGAGATSKGATASPPSPSSSAAAAAAADRDLECRLDRFQEDARVLVGVAKQYHHR